MFQGSTAQRRPNCPPLTKAVVIVRGDNPQAEPGGKPSKGKKLRAEPRGKPMLGEKPASQGNPVTHLRAPATTPRASPPLPAIYKSSGQQQAENNQQAAAAPSLTMQQCSRVEKAYLVHLFGQLDDSLLIIYIAIQVAQSIQCVAETYSGLHRPLPCTVGPQFPSTVRHIAELKVARLALLPARLFAGLFCRLRHHDTDYRRHRLSHAQRLFSEIITRPCRQSSAFQCLVVCTRALAYCLAIHAQHVNGHSRA